MTEKTNSNIYKYVTEYHGKLIYDKNHRYKSWEHCYGFFTDNSSNSDIDSYCLHLAFYLASWGMYRGSSFLLWKDYKVHQEVVKELLKNSDLQEENFLSINDAELHRIYELCEWIKNWYPQNIKEIDGEPKQVNVTDTLATKIMLGSLGCMPAYDTYFIKGLRKSGIPYSSLNIKNFRAVVEFYQKNQDEFQMAQRDIYNKIGVHYPAMKLLDMYFWVIGYQS